MIFLEIYTVFRKSIVIGTGILVYFRMIASFALYIFTAFTKQKAQEGETEYCGNISSFTLCTCTLFGKTTADIEYEICEMHFINNLGGGILIHSEFEAESFVSVRS